jgi:hypothetical protein
MFNIKKKTAKNRETYRGWIVVDNGGAWDAYGPGGGHLISWTKAALVAKIDAYIKEPY